MILVRHGESEFNVRFNKTRVDPGIRDPALTEAGRRQAADAARDLAEQPVRRVIASPYLRALQTAEIIAQGLGLPIEIDPIVGERCFFTCDIGTPTSELARIWPALDLDHLPELWWPQDDEDEDALMVRCGRFRTSMAQTTDWSATCVVSHWGFIRGLTGRELGNCHAIGFDPVSGSIRS